MIKDTNHPIDRQLVLCPVCDREENHIARVVAHHGRWETFLLRGSAMTVEDSGREWRPGAKVMVEMWCEYGHRFDLGVEVDHGRAYITRQFIGDSRPTDFLTEDLDHQQ